MPNKPTNPKSKRLRRRDPRRAGPNRRATDHIMLAANKQNSKKTGRGPNSRISESVQQAISEVVQQSSTFIEEQIRAGQAAAERLRDGIASSRQLNADINMVIENLVATTKDVGATWLELISIIIRSMGTQPPHGGGSNGGGKPTPHGPGATVTQTGTSGGATTTSSITPADSAIRGVPPQIIVRGGNVKSVMLDLRPPSSGFVPFVRQLIAADPKNSLGAKFTVSSNPPRLVLTVSVAASQPPGTYTAAIVDSSTNVAGGTLSVTVAG
jgi:hypothetical protein